MISSDWIELNGDFIKGYKRVRIPNVKKIKFAPAVLIKRTLEHNEYIIQYI